MARKRQYTEAQLVEMRAMCDYDEPDLNEPNLNAPRAGFPRGSPGIASIGSSVSPRSNEGHAGVLLTPCCCVLIVVGVVLALLGGGLVLFFVLKDKGEAKDKGDAGAGVAVHEVVPALPAPGGPARDEQVDQRQTVPVVPAQNEKVFKEEENEQVFKEEGVIGAAVAVHDVVQPQAAPQAVQQQAAPGPGQAAQVVPPRPEPPQINLKSLAVSEGFGVHLKALQMLEQREITFLFDDSGSMRINRRWTELKMFSGLAVDMLQDFRPKRFDIGFLNRDDKMNALPRSTSPEFERLFEAEPAGTTPIVKRLYEYRKSRVHDKQSKSGGLLLLVFTDGDPDRDDRYPFTDGEQAAKKEVQKIVEQFGKCNAFGPGTGVCLTFIVCSEEGVDWLENLDNHRTIGDSVDVIDDFQSERSQLKKDDQAKFNHQTWVAKMLIGATDRELDKMDERHRKRHRKPDLRGGGLVALALAALAD